VREGKNYAKTIGLGTKRRVTLLAKSKVTVDRQGNTLTRGLEKTKKNRVGHSSEKWGKGGLRTGRRTHEKKTLVGGGKKEKASVHRGEMQSKTSGKNLGSFLKKRTGQRKE